MLGFGNFYDPHLVLDDQPTGDPRRPGDLGGGETMQVALPDATPTTPPPATLAVPTSIDRRRGDLRPSSSTPEWLAPFQQQIDYLEGGPSGMSLPYDLVGVFSGGPARTRVLTGTIVIVRSAASAPVPPPIGVP